MYDPDRDQDENKVTASLGALALTLLFIVLGVFLEQKLAAQSHLEDCLMSGRTNCVPLWVPHR
jgi:hypothetical protein